MQIYIFNLHQPVCYQFKRTIRSIFAVFAFIGILSILLSTSVSHIIKKKSIQINWIIWGRGVALFKMSCCDLRKHVKIHSGEKSNKCNQCDYASSEPGHLRTHLTTHSGEKPNKCNQCDFASAQAGHLRIHLKTHIGEKLNKCNHCDFASFWPCALRRHIKMHNKEKKINLTAMWLEASFKIKFS